MYSRQLPIIKCKLFLPGKKISLNGEVYTVDHVFIKEDVLMVKFEELEKPVNSDLIPCEWDEIDFNN